MDNVSFFMDVFVNRFVPPYPVQYELDDGHWIYICVDERVTVDVVRRHLDGEITIGLYPSENSTVKWMVIDIDSRDIEVVTRVRDAVSGFGASPIVEDSGGRGFHIWVLFGQPEDNKGARFFGNLCIGKEKHEVFPKQDHTDAKAVGNLIKAPMGLHRKYGGQSYFVDEHFKRIDDPFGFLRDVPRFDLQPFLKKAYEVAVKCLPHSGANGFSFPAEFKPCVLRVVSDGSCSGARNVQGHIIATEVRRIGKDRIFAEGVLYSWNFRNSPPLAERELKTIISSVYDKKVVYEYGCNGKLLQYVNCLGKNSCHYYQSFLSKTTGFKRETSSERNK